MLQPPLLLLLHLGVIECIVGSDDQHATDSDVHCAAVWDGRG